MPASVRSCSSVQQAFVRYPAGRLVERFTAVRTLVRAFPRVDAFVRSQGTFKVERFGAERAQKRSLGSVALLVSF